MKTTVEIPDDLLIRAKKRAAELRRPLRELIESGLKAQITPPRASEKPRRVNIRWVVVDGGLPRGLDPADRVAMHERLRRRTP